MDKNTNPDKNNKVKVEFDRDVLESLLKMKSVGESYSDVVRRMLGDTKEK